MALACGQAGQGVSLVGFGAKENYEKKTRDRARPHGAPIDPTAPRGLEAP